MYSLAIIPYVIIEGNRIEHNQTFQDLGIVYDSLGTWKTHYEAIIQTLKTSMPIRKTSFLTKEELITASSKVFEKFLMQIPYGTKERIYTENYIVDIVQTKFSRAIHITHSHRSNVHSD